MGPAVGVTRHAATLAATLVAAAVGSSCAFRNEVDVGGHGLNPAAGGANGGGGVLGGAGHGGVAGARTAPVGGSSAGGSGGPVAPPDELTACGLGQQNVVGFVPPRDSADSMSEGEGGLLEAGSYRLVALVEHGACGCFDADTPLAQTLVLDGETGFVISDSIAGAHWAGTFRYSTAGNAIAIEPICFESGQRVASPGPFGPFSTYSVSDDVVWLLSPACHYRAAYQRLPLPPAR